MYIYIIRSLAVYFQVSAISERQTMQGMGTVLRRMHPAIACL